MQLVNANVSFSESHLVASRYDNSQSLAESWVFSNDTIACLCGLLLWPTQWITRYLSEQD